MEITLREIAYIRGENKDSVSETNLAAHTPHGYDFLVDRTRPDLLRTYLKLSEDAEIACTGMPILGAVKIVLADTGARAGAAPLGETLLDLRVDIPEDYLRKCRL